MRDQPAEVEHAVDEQAEVAEEAPVESEVDDDDLFVENVDQGVTHEGMSKGKKAAATSTSTTKFQQVDRSSKAMESHQESLLSLPQDSICPSLEKRLTILSNKDDEKCDGLSSESTSQTALYNHAKGDGAEDEQGKSLGSSVSSKRPRCRMIYIGGYTVQCAICRKWRLVPTKKKYEEIRERSKEDPFTCEKARQWNPDVACDDPSEVSQDGSQLWAMDQHNIPQAPPGWDRSIRIRSEGCTKFADVYYISPTGKKLRSIKEVDACLKENPEYAVQGVKLSQFSFKIPAPAQPGYVRKRPRTSRNDGTKPLLEEVQPITWEAPATHEDLGEINQLVPYNEDPPEMLLPVPTDTEPGNPLQPPTAG